MVLFSDVSSADSQSPDYGGRGFASYLPKSLASIHPSLASTTVRVALV
jgi:hypothetical protein